MRHASGIRLESVPGDQEVEDGHGEGQVRLKACGGSL